MSESFPPRADGRAGTPFAALRRFARPPEAPAVPAAEEAVIEHCELCGVVLAPEHRHLLEVASRQIQCACGPCALCFQEAVGGRFKLIPRDARSLPDFRLEDAAWENLSLPINLAFFFYSTPRGKMAALYPSPAGVTESLLPLSAWESIVAENPALADLQPDVEALLINRIGAARAYYLAPIDACFELVGLIRIHWRGLSGGTEVWREIDAYFARLAERARPWEAPLEAAVTYA
jgi:hypothetical protein